MTASDSRAGHPYLSKRYAFDRLFGDIARSRRIWQCVALVALAVSLVLATGFVLVARQHKVVPYVVEVDALGEVRTSVALASAEPPERALQAALRRFVFNLRTVPSDMRLLNVQLARAQAFVTGKAHTSLAQEIHAQSEQIQSMLRSGSTRYVDEISSILKVPGEEGVYRVTWRESFGTRLRQSAKGYEGHFKVRVITPESESTLAENPLGIFVTDYTWAGTGARP